MATVTASSSRPRSARPHGSALHGRRRGRSETPARRRNGRVALLLITPATIGFLVFAVYPMLRSIYLSFTDFHVLTPPKWTGLANFRELLSDSTYWASLRVTLYFVALSVAFGIAISLLTAVILHRLTRSTLVRALVILPFLISGVVAALTWHWMLDPELGIVNIALGKLTGHTIMFFGSQQWAIPTIALVSVWKSMGYNAILIFAGLQTIPNEIYEAGRIDGASEAQMFRKITVPLLRPILAMVVILTVISSFQVFDIVAVTTKGGPANATNVLQLYIFREAFGQLDFGYASTMSLTLFVMLAVVSYLQMRLARANTSDLGS